MTAEIAILEAEREELLNEKTNVSRAKAALKTIEIAEKKSQIETSQKQLDRNYNEMSKMFAIAKEMEKKIAGKDRKQLEQEFWIEKLSRDIVINTQYGGQNLSGVAETISTLPDEMQMAIANPERRERHRLANDRKLLK